MGSESPIFRISPLVLCSSEEEQGYQDPIQNETAVITLSKLQKPQDKLNSFPYTTADLHEMEQMHTYGMVHSHSPTSQEET